MLDQTFDRCLTRCLAEFSTELGGQFREASSRKIKRANQHIPHQKQHGVGGNRQTTTGNNVLAFLFFLSVVGVACFLLLVCVGNLSVLPLSFFLKGLAKTPDPATAKET